MKSLIDWYIKLVDNRNKLELSILKKHRGFTGFLIIFGFIVILLFIVYMMYIQLSINALLEPSESTSSFIAN